MAKMSVVNFGGENVRLMEGSVRECLAVVHTMCDAYGVTLQREYATKPRDPRALYEPNVALYSKHGNTAFYYRLGKKVFIECLDSESFVKFALRIEL